MHSLLMPLAVLVRPRRTLSELRDHSRWVWAAALLFVVLTLVAKLVVGMPHMLALQEKLLSDANVGVSYSSESAEDERGSATKVDVKEPSSPKGADEEVVVPEDVKQTAATVTTISSYVFGILGVFAGALLLAAVIYAICRIWSKETPFAVVLGVVALAKMPEAVRNIVQTAYTAATGTWVQHQGLGALVVPENLTRPTVAYSLLSLVDVYAIWFAVLLFLGLVYAAGLERRRAAIVTGAFVALGVAFAVVPALLASAFVPA